MTVEDFLLKNTLSVSSEKQYICTLNKYSDIDALEPQNIFNLINDTDYTLKTKNDKLHHVLTYYRVINLTSKFKEFEILLNTTPYEIQRLAKKAAYKESLTN